MYAVGLGFEKQLRHIRERNAEPHLCTQEWNRSKQQTPDYFRDVLDWEGAGWGGGGKALPAAVL